MDQFLCVRVYLWSPEEEKKSPWAGSCFVFNYGQLNEESWKQTSYVRVFGTNEIKKEKRTTKKRNYMCVCVCVAFNHRKEGEIPSCRMNFNPTYAYMNWEVNVKDKEIIKHKHIVNMFMSKRNVVKLFLCV